MSWLGAGIGAGIGFVVLGGPIGAALGAWIGSALTGNSDERQLSTENQNKQLFFVSLFSMFGKLAKADGVVSQEEIQAVENIMTQMKLDDEDKSVARQFFNNAKSDTYSIYDYAKQYAEIFTNQEMRLMVYRSLWVLSLSDNVLHKNEETILKQIPHYLGISLSYFTTFKDELVRGKKSNLDECYQLLGCNKNSTNAEIKKAYRKLVGEYHPDKIQSKGLPEEFLKFANDQMHKINEAYKLIMDSR